MTMSIPPEKSKKIVIMIKSIRNRKSMKKRDFARFVGILVSVCPASPYGWAHIKKFEYYKYKALKRCFGNYDGTLKISNDLHDDFLWWTMNLASSELSLLETPYVLTIFSDASNWGQRPNICVASTLKYYIDFTKTLIKNNDQLLITTKKPHHPATPQTVSKWFKKGLTLGGVDTSVFKAHSTRHASTSAVFMGGLNIETIRRTAGWSDRSNVFLTFYNRPISDDSDFEKPLINKN
nr:unnamed protein product [Callosobruchus chinensis]